MDITDITIKKAKLCKGGCVETTFIDQDGNEISLKGKNKCHMDLRVAISSLVPFFADLTEQKEADSIDWDNLDSQGNRDLLNKLDVTGLSISGDGDNQVFTMTGKRTLISRRVLNLNAPGVEMYSDTLEWDHVDEFDMAVQGFLYEVKEYIVNKKWEVSQGELNFDGDPDDPFAEAKPTDDVPIENVA